jgi:hypothetical protein
MAVVHLEKNRQVSNRPGRAKVRTRDGMFWALPRSIDSGMAKKDSMSNVAPRR